MRLEQTELTPELAAVLIAKAHPHQRRPARGTVDMYARAIKEGRWALVADALLVDPEGRMFNGGHRCAAVIMANRAIPVYIGWDADPSTFDVIDVGRRRAAYQFISESEATARASAARVTLWYSRRFEHPLDARALQFDLHEILAEADRRAEAFSAIASAARQVYEYTSIPRSIVMAAFAIAIEYDYDREVDDFVAGIVDPSGLDEGDPRRLLADRFRKVTHRAKRRQPGEDWTLLVRSFNLFLEGVRPGRIAMSEVWPRVAETETEYRRRRDAVLAAKHRIESARNDRKAASA